MSRLLALRDLIHDAIDKVTDLVEETHETVISRHVDLLAAVTPAAEKEIRAVDAARRLGTAAIYETVRATNRAVRLIQDASLSMGTRTVEQIAGEDATQATLSAARAELGAEAAQRLAIVADAAQGALNGAVGDFLRDRGNGLGVQMSFFRAGAAVLPHDESLAATLGDDPEKVCVFVHGLGCTEHAWNFLSGRFYDDPNENFGTLLQKELGYAPLWVRYNSGLHVSENGQRLSLLLSELVAARPSIREIALVGHSMGGLVSRSAAHYGNTHGASWVTRLTHVFCIGSPHLGAPLEKGAGLLAALLDFFPTAGTQVPAKIMNARSAGIKDLRFGYILDEDWSGKDPNGLTDNRHDVPFVDWAVYCFIASTLTRDPEHPLSMLLGDVLVRVPSATGRAPEPERRVPFHVGTVLGGAHHLETMNHPHVYAVLKRWLVEARPIVPELS